MSEHIEREAALKNKRWNGRLDEYVIFARDIEAIPAADVVERKPIKTNGDKLRAKTDEELADWLEPRTCQYGWLHWLKQEVQNEGGR